MHANAETAVRSAYYMLFKVQREVTPCHYETCDCASHQNMHAQWPAFECVSPLFLPFLQYSTPSQAA